MWDAGTALPPNDRSDKSPLASALPGVLAERALSPAGRRSRPKRQRRAVERVGRRRSKQPRGSAPSSSASGTSWLSTGGNVRWPGIRPRRGLRRVVGSWSWNSR
jgi:hypothetical protein